MGDEIVKVLILGRPNGLEAEAIEDQKIGLGQGLEAALEIFDPASTMPFFLGSAGILKKATTRDYPSWRLRIRNFW
jgi:hypothetical protein